MKRNFILLCLLSLCLSAVTAQNNDLSGFVTYKNSVFTPMKDSTFVYLLKNNVVMYTDTVNSTGMYQFYNVVADTYQLKAFSIKKWGGVNAVDALLIEKHFVGMQPPLTGLNLTVGDVNQSGGIPAAVDALACVRRFVGAISNFAPAPDWYSTKYTIGIIAGDILTQDILMLCAGDVNGSFIPY